jgi:adenylyltransferase/sulfurtransferase
VVGVLPGIIGTIQANEVIKLIVGGGKPLIGRLLTLDAWRMKFRELKIEKSPTCPICGKNPTITELEEYDYEEFCSLKKHDEEEPVEAISAKDLHNKIENDEPITIIDVREPHERAIVKFPNAKVIPIGQLARRMDELNPDIETVFICKEGKRSILAINTLREAGYKGKMYNLKDGINTWAKEIDKSMPQY